MNLYYSHVVSDFAIFAKFRMNEHLHQVVIYHQHSPALQINVGKLA